MLGSTRLFPGDLGHEPALTPRERPTPRCPVCGEETWELVRDRWGDTVGCLACVDVFNAAEGSEDALALFWNGGV
jgi:rubredoxin